MASSSRDEMRHALAKVEQNLALAAQTQRDADRQLQALELRRERLEQQHREVSVPDAAEIERLEGDLAAMGGQLEQAQADLAGLEDQLPALDQRPRQAPQAALHAAQGPPHPNHRTGAQ